MTAVLYVMGDVLVGWAMIDLDRIRDRLWRPSGADMVQLIGEVELLYANAAQSLRTITDLREEIQRWRDTASAAADELESYWALHCDSNGEGPLSLLRRLRNRPDYYPGHAEREGASLERERIMEIVGKAMVEAEGSDDRNTVAALRALESLIRADGDEYLALLNRRPRVDRK
jgi:hypothetical protein